MTPIGSWGRLGDQPHEVVPLPDPASTAQAIAGTALPGLAYGMGRSYGDVGLNPGGTLWDARPMDRFIAFDETTGELTCEAGAVLGDIQRTFAARGWMLAVSPGTQFVTVGGAIANDVHGKNHHVRGSFGEHVSAMTLVRTDGRVIECGPDRERAWWAATIGGMGLTGVITRATLRLARVPSAWLDSERIVFSGLREFFDLADSSEAAWEYTVAWIDCVARSARGVFFRANPAQVAGEREPRANRREMPFELPLVGHATVRAFNMAYFAAQRAAPRRSLQHYRPFLYPLDHVAHWNRMYGPRGFYQYQSVVPNDAREDATRAMLDEISRSGQGSFLAVLKTFGRRESPGLLSFPMHGTTLALDFANAGEPTLRLFERLDAIVRECGGRIYPAKDARMPRDIFEQGYPRLAEFKAFRDPGISSAMSRRLLGD